MNSINMQVDKAQEAGTPEYIHRMKLVQEKADRERNTKIIAEYIELSPNPNHAKGGKVLQVVITNNGYKHRTYVGREKQANALIAKAKKNGTFYLTGQEPPRRAR